MQNFTQATRFLSLGRGGSPAQELKTCQKKTQSFQYFFFICYHFSFNSMWVRARSSPPLSLPYDCLSAQRFSLHRALSLHPLENGEHRGCFSPRITVNSIFLLCLLQGTLTKPPSNVSTTSSWRGPAFERQPPRRVPGQCRVFVTGRGSEEDSAPAPAPGLGETSIPHRHCPVPSSQCSIAQALWKEGWISRAFRVFKMGGGGGGINAKFLWIEDTACWQKPLFTDSSRLKSETLKSGYCGCVVFFFSKQSGTQFCSPVSGPNPAFLSRSDSHWL